MLPAHLRLQFVVLPLLIIEDAEGCWCTGMCFAQVSAAVMDISAMAPTLPPAVLSALESHECPEYKEARELPEWGKAIFSPFVRFVRPTSVEEENFFAEEIRAYLKIIRCVICNWGRLVVLMLRKKLVRFEGWLQQQLVVFANGSHHSLWRGMQDGLWHILTG